MRDYPQMIAETGRVEPAPRRVRGVLAGRTVFDTVTARYVWESPKYPQYYVPLADVDQSVLVDEQHPQKLKRGTAHRHGLRVDATARPGSARVYRTDTIADLVDTVRFEWDALDAWYEEDEQVFVHPRNPYTRVDAIRSSRAVVVQLDGVILAETSSPVLVFETGLPTRYYLPRPHVNFDHLVPTDTVTACPYKGTTSGYWSVRTGDAIHADLAWSYDFPTAALLPIAGMVAFYNEQVDHVIEGELLARPVTHFFA
jgi:uncharacterized protein (DUF427 family)